jgi:hypothetical protein
MRSSEISSINTFDATTAAVWSSSLFELFGPALCQRGYVSLKSDVANDESAARKKDEMYLIILKNIHVEGRNIKFWLIFFGRKDP